jgi:hypothetical protein
VFGIGDLFHRHPLRELIPLLSIELPCEVASRTVPGQLKPHSLHVVLIDSGTVRQHLTEATLAWANNPAQPPNGTTSQLWHHHRSRRGS